MTVFKYLTRDSKRAKALSIMEDIVD